MEQLTDRRQQVLKNLVEAYVESAQPVSSEAIARSTPTNVSSATVRNELAALEALGLVMHPHTSAGRIPTELGYRYFVEHLMEHAAPPPVEQRTIRDQFHQIQLAADRWAVLAASILASTVRSASIVTLPLAPRARVRSLELLSVQDDLGLLVLIVQSGIVRQQLIHLSRPVSRHDLNQLSNRLSHECEGCTAEELLQRAVVADTEEAAALTAAAQLMSDAEQHMYDSLYFEGISHVLDQPEFARSQALRPFVELLERTPVLGTYLVQSSAPDSVRIIIGNEHALDRMQHTSTVLTRYGVRGGPYGVIAVVGPTRMAYWRAVSMVRFMASVMDVLTDEPAERVS
jgi:heat-inducible transcriptional repressor